ncbi:MAG: hypothetical protein R2795_12705 [Saprospiraceae bacterium]
MKKALFFCFALCGLWGSLWSQQEYFQQEVNIRMAVRLDDEHHQLHGQWSMEYINQSPDALDTLYMHLWPNAHSSPTTAFARQQLAAGSTTFYFAEEKDRGSIDSLAFTANGQTLPILPTRYSQMWYD